MPCAFHRHVVIRSFSFGPSPALRLLRPLLTSRSVFPRRPFRHKARSPQVRTHTFIAQPPDLRRLALITRASRLLARSPCSAAPSIRFLFIGSQFMLHASFPQSVALMQLRFASFAVINLRRDLHPQVCAHAGRTKKALLSQGQCFPPQDRSPEARGRFRQFFTCLLHQLALGQQRRDDLRVGQGRAAAMHQVDRAQVDLHRVR